MVDIVLANSSYQVYEDIRERLMLARRRVESSVNHEMVLAYWEIGKRISEEQGNRAEYGKRLIAFLAEKLTAEFGQSFSERNLRYMRQFYRAFPIVNALRSQLAWTHYRLIMRLQDEEQRRFYMNEAANENWSSRQLSRQINSHYYERILAGGGTARNDARRAAKEAVPRSQADELIKDPYVLDFLQLAENNSIAEKELEQALIDKLQEFLLELGKGFSFVARQKRVSDGEEDYFIDLVFYNYFLKCFVLIDLKAGKLTPQDVGQMDFYVRLFEDKFRLAEDNPPIGLILCANKNETVAKYSALADRENLFASQYILYLPSEEELAGVVERAQIKHVLEADFDDGFGDAQSMEDMQGA